MRVRHVSFSRSGGAGVVSQTLAAAQRQIGIDASEYYSVSNGALKENFFGDLPVAASSVIDRYLVRNSSATTQFSFLRNRNTNKSVTDNICDVYHLHWATGMLSNPALWKILDQGSKIVWTLHDYNPVSGGCHNPECDDGLRNGCGSCPIVRSPFHRKISELAESRLAIASHPNLQLVAVSNHMFDSLGRFQKFTKVIPNPISDEFMRPITDAPTEGKIQLVFVAKNTGDHWKGLSVARALADRVVGAGIDARLLIIGGGRVHKIKKHEETMGMLGAKQLAQIFETSHFLISASNGETFSLVSHEAASMGCPTLHIGDSSGEWLRDIQGKIVTSEREALDFIRTISKKNLRIDEQIRERVRRQNNSSNVASKYIDIYKSLLSWK